MKFQNRMRKFYQKVIKRTKRKQIFRFYKITEMNKYIYVVHEQLATSSVFLVLFLVLMFSLRI